MSQSDTSSQEYRSNRSSISGNLLDVPDDENELLSPDIHSDDHALSMNDRLAIQNSRYTSRDKPRTCCYTFCDDEFVAPIDDGSSNTGTRRSDRTGDEYPIGYNPDYCSKRCLFFEKGAKALRGVRYDHRFCASCFRRLKELEPPGRGLFKWNEEKRLNLASKPLPDFATERQYYMFYTIGAEKTVRMINPGSGPGEPLMVPSRFGIIRKGGGCFCGAAHHSTVSRPSRISTTEWTGGHEYDYEDEAYIPRLIEALEDQRDRGEFDRIYSEAKLYDKIKRLNENPDYVDQSQRQLCEALGSAIRYPHYKSD